MVVFCFFMFLFLLVVDDVGVGVAGVIVAVGVVKKHWARN